MTSSYNALLHYFLELSCNVLPVIMFSLSGVGCYNSFKFVLGNAEKVQEYFGATWTEY